MMKVSGVMGANYALNFNVIRLLTISIALLLPYVFIEPAPVDLMLVMMSIYVLFTLRIPSFGLFLYLTYLLFTLISISLGVIFDPVKQEAIFKYFFIELYLASSILAIGVICYEKDYFIPLFLRWYAIGAAVSCIAVLLIKFGPDNLNLIYRDEYRVRVKGFFKDPNVLAPYLVFPILAAHFSSGILNLKRLKYIILISCLILVLLSFSRGGYVALLVAFLFGTFIKMFREYSVAILVVGVLSIFLFALAAQWLISTGYFEDFEYLLSRLELKDYDQSRFFHISNSLEIGFLNPLGIGPEGYSKTYGVNPHNLFAGKLVDAGLIPAIIISSIPLSGWILSTLSYLKYRDDLSLLLAATMIGQVVASLVVYSHHWRHMLILGVIASVYSLHNRFKNNPKALTIKIRKVLI